MANTNPIVVLLLNIALLHLSQGQGPSEFAINVACHNQAIVYVDGQEVGRASWPQTVSTYTSPNSKVIAIECGNTDNNAGLIAQIDSTVTDQSWLCHYENQNGWNEYGFNADSWGPANVIGPNNGLNLRGKIDSIEERASWIWTKGVMGEHKKIYCRFNLEPATCVVYGDPHLITFDRQRVDFQGSCKYNLASMRTDIKGLTTFKISVKHETRNAVPNYTYIKYIEIELLGKTIRIGKGKTVTVDGIRVIPEVQYPRFSIKYHGLYVLLDTDFHLEIRYNGDDRAEIRIPHIYWNLMQGLCGNYNSISKDDFRNSIGQDLYLMPNNVQTLGQSWQVDDPEDPRCITINIDPPTCLGAKDTIFQTNSYCGLLKSLTGPFSACLVVPNIGAKDFFDTCVYDACANENNLSVAKQLSCASLHAFAQECAKAGVVVDWRFDADCPVSCPANSVYSASPFTGCTNTCGNPKADDSSCQLQATEACQCLPGYIMRDNACVTANQCDCSNSNTCVCVDMGKTYKNNVKWISADCTEQYTCIGIYGRITSVPYSCKVGERCVSTASGATCQKIPPATTTTVKPTTPKPNENMECSIIGDPHYSTFDGLKFDFMGKCKYNMVTLKDVATTLLIPKFSINVKNEFRNNVDTWSYARYVEISIAGNIVRLDKNRVVWVNGVKVFPEVSLPQVYLIRYVGLFVILETTFGLKVQFNGIDHVKITLPSAFRNSVEGLCGNYNGAAQDDYRLPSGQDISVNANKESLLGNAWQVIDFEDIGCTGSNVNPDPPKCRPDKEAIYRGVGWCGAILDKVNGPFKNCIADARISSDFYYKNCMFDTCANQDSSFGSDKVAACGIIWGFATACSDYGYAMLQDWRAVLGCPAPCPVDSGMVYKLTAPACFATCNNPEALFNCYLPYAEGCVCPPGLPILKDGVCVKPSDCTCEDQGMSYQIGAQWLTSGCSAQKACVACENCAYPVGRLTVLPYLCDAGQNCDFANGAYQCVQPTAPVTCEAQGDPHFTTFDGTKYDFMGKCKYNFASVKASATGAPSFNIYVKNEMRNNDQRYSYTKYIEIQINNHIIQFLKGRAVKVDGITRYPEITSLTGIKIYYSGLFIRLETDFGLVVIFNGNDWVKVTIPQLYRGKMEGLCGEFNGNRNDDFRRADGLDVGTQVNKEELFGNSWSVSDPDEPNCFGGPNPPQPPCTQASLFQSNAWCGIFSNKAGTFGRCLSNSLISWKNMYDTCVYDVCANGDDLVRAKASLCSSLHVLATACFDIGIWIDWRAEFGCTVACPATFVYQAKASPCIPTCTNPGAADGCLQPPQENCACPLGQVFKNGECVLPNKCGCVDSHGVARSIGERWLTGACTVQNTCTACPTCKYLVGQIISVNTGCPIGLRCGMLPTGVIGCTAWGASIQKTVNVAFLIDTNFQGPLKDASQAPPEIQFLISFLQWGNQQKNLAAFQLNTIVYPYQPTLYTGKWVVDNSGIGGGWLFNFGSSGFFFKSPTGSFFFNTGSGGAGFLFSSTPSGGFTFTGNFNYGNLNQLDFSVPDFINNVLFNKPGEWVIFVVGDYTRPNMARLQENIRTITSTGAHVVPVLTGQVNAASRDAFQSLVPLTKDKKFVDLTTALRSDLFDNVFALTQDY